MGPGNFRQAGNRTALARKSIDLLDIISKPAGKGQGVLVPGRYFARSLRKIGGRALTNAFGYVMITLAFGRFPIWRDVRVV